MRINASRVLCVHVVMTGVRRRRFAFTWHGCAVWHVLARVPSQAPDVRDEIVLRQRGRAVPVHDGPEHVFLQVHRTARTVRELGEPDRRGRTPGEGADIATVSLGHDDDDAFGFSQRDRRADG